MHAVLLMKKPFILDNFAAAWKTKMAGFSHMNLAENSSLAILLSRSNVPV